MCLLPQELAIAFTEEEVCDGFSLLALLVRVIIGNRDHLRTVAH